MSFYFKTFLFTVILFINTPSISQTKLSNEVLKTIPSLEERIDENQKLLLTDLDAAKINIDLLLEEAISIKDNKAELTLLANTCRYYFQKEDAANLLKASERLFEKAREYEDIRVQALSKMYLAESFKLNNLFDDALFELENALELIEKEDSNKINVINTKSNIYISYANTYSYLNQARIAVKMMKKGGEEFDKVPPGEYRDFLNYLYHSNLGVYYMAYSKDSSEYHALKSISLKPKDMEKDDVIMVRNYYSLGKVYTEKMKFDNAIEYLNKAELAASEIGEYVNLKETYEAFINLANQMGNEEAMKEYTNKLKSLKLMQFETKNRSLHEIIEKQRLKHDEIDKQNRKTFYNWIVLIIGISVVAIAISIFIYRNKIHSKYERLSKEYLEDNKAIEKDQLKLYNAIIDLIKNDDPAFMVSFNKAFPNFTDSLLKINPKLVQGEVEFCALLKLNLTTKQIAQYKVIQPRTVQNKKYQIRKKLNIPKNIDIYNWIHGI